MNDTHLGVLQWANKPQQPLFPLGLATSEQSAMEGILNTGVIEHGPDAVMTLPEGNVVDGLPSSIRYNPNTDQFEGFYAQGGWSSLGGGGGIRWEALPHAATANLATGRGYLIDNTSGVSKVVFPTPTKVGDSVTICDAFGKFSVYPLTVNGNGKAIYGSTTEMTLSTDNVAATFTWSGDARGWVITAGVGLGQGRVYSRTVFTSVLSATTSKITLTKQPSIVDVYVDGKRLIDSKYTLSGYDVNFAPSLASGTEVQIIEYTPIQLAEGGGGGGSTTPMITWVYRNGSAIGGETTIVLDVDAPDVPEIFICGVRNQKGLGYDYDASTNTITLAEELETGDDVVVKINAEPSLYNQIDRTPNEVARAANVPVSAVIMSSDVNSTLGGKTIVFDETAQKIWTLPSGIPSGAKIISVNGTKLTYTGNVIVDLVPLYGPADTLNTKLASTAGAAQIGLAAGGKLSDTIQRVYVEQWSNLVGVDNDWSAALQAAIDYVAEAGGGVVQLGAKTYIGRATLKPRVVIEGQGREVTMIKAPDGWDGNAVIMTQGYLTYNYDSNGKMPPGCYSSGLRYLTVHGNKDNFAGVPAKDYGCGVLHAGLQVILDQVKIIYCPSACLVTKDWGSDRPQYQAADPNRGWAHIGTIRGLRLQFAGNDVWHCESLDAFVDDVEITGAGYGFVSADDTRSFWQPTQRVANVRFERGLTVGFLHTYGNYNGYGLVVGNDNVSGNMRFQYDQIITESCMIGAWFRPSAVPAGGKLDCHQCSGHLAVALHGSFTKVPTLIVDCANPGTNGNMGNIYVNNTGSDYDGINVCLNGQYYTVGSINISRSPTIAAALKGHGLYIGGSNIRVESGLVMGFYGTTSYGEVSSAVIFGGGANNYVNITVSGCERGFNATAANVVSEGELKSYNANTAWTGFDTWSVMNRQNIKMHSNAVGGRSGNNFAGVTAAIATNSTAVQTISVTGLDMPYVPAVEEVGCQLAITAFQGSSILPYPDTLVYDLGASDKTKLTFRVKLANTDSPMQAVIRYKLN